MDGWTLSQYPRLVLKNPYGQTVATFNAKDFAWARQVVAAMNLTTTKERQEWCALFEPPIVPDEDFIDWCNPDLSKQGAS